MNLYRRSANPSPQSGQSLIETAILLPLLLLLTFNVINFAYYFLVGVHLASASREGVQYAVMGPETPGQAPFPPATLVRDLTRSDMSALGAAVSATVRVCTTAPASSGGSAMGTTGTGASTVANCAAYGSGTTLPGPSPDPEAPLFVLYRVDIQYTINPLIPLRPFGIVDITQVLPQFHRQVSMRQM